MGSHASYNPHFEFANQHQQELRAQRASDRLAQQAGAAMSRRSAALAMPRRFLDLAVRALEEQRLLCKSVATLE